MMLLYGEKHYERLNKLQQASYICEYMSSSMSLLPVKEEGEEKGNDKSLPLRYMNTHDDDDINNFIPIIFAKKNNEERKIADEAMDITDEDDTDEDRESIRISATKIPSDDINAEDNDRKEITKSEKNKKRKKASHANDLKNDSSIKKSNKKPKI